MIDVGCNLKQFDGLTWLTPTQPHILRQIYATANQLRQKRSSSACGHIICKWSAFDWWYLCLRRHQTCRYYSTPSFASLFLRGLWSDRSGTVPVCLPDWYGMRLYYNYYTALCVHCHVHHYSPGGATRGSRRSDTRHVLSWYARFVPGCVVRTGRVVGFCGLDKPAGRPFGIPVFSRHSNFSRSLSVIIP